MGHANCTAILCTIVINEKCRRSQVVSTGPNPEWDETFAWAFESPPKGQKLHISCKNKSKMGKVNESEKNKI